jgi:signal transduction histidine kinase
VRRRILASIVVVAALAVLLFGVPLAFAVRNLYLSEETVRLERTATRAAGALPATGLKGVDPVDLPHPEPETSVALYDQAGRRAVGTGPADGGRAVQIALTGSVADTRDGGSLVVAVPVHDEETVVGAARASAPLTLVNARVHRAWLAMALLALVVVAVAAVVARRAARRLAAPVDELARALQRLGDGDFTARAPHHGIAELDEAADALAHTADRLDLLLERERAFSADASHQLATPLTGLRATLEGALITPGADLRAAAVEAVEEADRLHRTISDLLSLTRDTARTTTAAELSAAFDEVRERRHAELARAGRPLRVDLAPGLPETRTSAAAIRQILQVLVDNAIVHGDGAVTVRARPVGTGVVVEVEDEGPGVTGDPEAVFERRSSEARGNGIGLALARSLAAADGGRLVLRRPGPHPVFTVVLPAG